jgi:glutaredoxin
MKTVTLYGKPGCCLCDEARAVIRRLLERHTFQLEEIDVSIDPSLHRRYGERVPVVAVDGQEAFEYHVETAALAKLL